MKNCHGFSKDCHNSDDEEEAQRGSGVRVSFVDLVVLIGNPYWL